MVECDEPESECYFKCLNHNKPKVRRSRCLCKTYSERRRRRKQLGEESCDWSRLQQINQDICSDLDVVRYERKDDMLFGQWQAQLMLEKGQTTEGVRIDKKITVNPLFKDFIPKGRSAAGSAAGFLGKINTDKTNLALPMSSTTKIDSRFDIQRAIGAVVKWDKYREGDKFVIPYFYQAGYTEDLKQDISRALKDLGDNTCIDFKVVSESSKQYDHKIKIVAGSGCYSYVGFQGVNHQTISLREVGCLSRGTVQHEFMHALGFYHEQARPDAKDFIKVQYQNVGDMCGSTGQESCRTQFDSLPLHEWESSRRGGAYDIRSVMHYGGFDFSAEGAPTLLDMENEPVRDQRLRFSQSDAEQICEIYKCEQMGRPCMGGKWECKNGIGYTYKNKLCDGLTDCADGSDEEGCIEKSCCDRVHVDGLTFIRQEDRLMNGRPFYELEGAGEDVYLYYYHDGKKNRYWLISKYINVLSVFGYSFEEVMCPQEMHIRSSLGGEWKWAWASCAHAPKYGSWSDWTSCSPSQSKPGTCDQQRVRFCKGGAIGYNSGCPVDGDHEKVACDCQTGSQMAIEAAPVESVQSTPVEAVEDESSTKWTSWSQWGACNRSCGDGQQTRVRTCEGGAIGTGNCHANNWKEVKKCNQKECPAWASWSPWSGCNVTCGNGKQVRMRDCNGAKIGSRACPARQATETQPCGGFPCARWAKWNTWSPCSQTCGESEQVRVRTCIFGQIGDDGCAAKDAKEQQACKLRDCDTQLWSSWGQWTQCTAECGTGMQMRQRDCLVHHSKCAVEDGLDQRPCNTEACSAAFWSNWNSWSDCSATCDGGTQSRTRSCTNGDIGTGKCTTGGDNDNQPCNTDACERTNVPASGCPSESSYLFKACKDMRRKPARADAAGNFAHGVSCGAVLCSKQFFGFGWKAKTAKVVCECKDGACAWSKPLHKCPTGCSMPPEWEGDRCTKQLNPKKNRFLLADEYTTLKSKVMYTPKASKCKAIKCANDPNSVVKAPRCNCDAKGQCDWSKTNGLNC